MTYCFWCKPLHTHRLMPMLLAQLLTCFFIWLAENVSTFSKIWLYPNQQAQWKMVGIDKFGSWFLLLIVSYALVLLVNKPKRIAE